MKIHKKVAGGASTLGDLKQFIQAAEKEGFDDDSRLNNGHEIGLFVEVNEGESTEAVIQSDYEGKCPECREYVPCTNLGIALVHHRGNTIHRDTQCYGVGKKVYGLAKK